VERQLQPGSLMRPTHGVLPLLFILAACASPTAETGSDEAAIEEGVNAFGEQLEPNEAALVRQIADAATTQVLHSRDTSPDRVARRDAHPKAHGCVTASFAVNANLPADFRVGTFKPGARYDAWIRFSNGSQADDRENDARGMAVKVLGVSGDRLLSNEEATAHTHDFVLSNHHTFFITNIADYVGFMQAVTEKGNPISFFLSWNPFEMHLREAWLARKFTTQPITSPLTSRYWSVTPYALGSPGAAGAQVVKYSATPCAGADTSGEHPDSADYLAAAMKGELGQADACFDFSIQRRAIPEDMPVEDTTTTWSEDDAPFVPVARITIPKQAFDSDAQKTHCENLSFSPWHATKEHRPLGSINRTRKVVYEATSEARHRLNGAPRVEPVDLQIR
jgi:hypothetical protein